MTARDLTEVPPREPGAEDGHVQRTFFAKKRGWEEGGKRERQTDREREGGWGREIDSWVE